MKMRLWICTALAAGFLFGPRAVTAADQTKKLNVLFIAVDDLNNRLGCYGAGDVKSPNVDRLSQMGRRFDRAYCNYPLCNPTRTSLMSGWRPEHTKVWANTEAPRAHLAGATPLQEHFHANGYFTARVGKIYHSPFEKEFQWDVAEDPTVRVQQARAQQTQDKQEQRAAGGPRRRGAGARAGADSRPASGRAAVQDRRARLRAESGDGSEAPGKPQPTNREDKDEPDGWTVRRVAQLLKEHKDQPFFIAAGLHKPHLPWVAPKKYFDMYPPAGIKLVAAPADDLDDIPPIAFTPKAAPRISEEKRKEAVAAYYACVTFMDAQVGVLLEAMDRLKLWDNTVVVLWGDHGWSLGEHSQWAKMSLFEESARAPLLFAVPGMSNPGVPTGSFAEFVDIYPTLVDLCGLPKVDGLEGGSLTPILRDPDTKIKNAAFTVVVRRGGLGRSVRTDHYRYTQWPNGSAELYDHQNDPHEYTNLAKDPKHANAVDEMKKVLDGGWQAAILR